MHISNPFDLDDDAAYRTWRTGKLAAYPAGVEDLRVAVGCLAAPGPDELDAIARRVALYNMALVQTDPEQIAPAGILAFGRALGLRTADSNLFADAQAVSAISPGGSDERAEYIPYTARPLSWHTDGYYNPPDAQVRAWTLFCRRPARICGVNSLLDHELAYVLLRDRSPEHIRALSHPEALGIPANVRDGQVLRAASLGPVFSTRDGRLHMRYSARARHVTWRSTVETNAAREALDRLFSPSPIYTFAHSLQSGEGLVSNNVLHNRTGFEEEPDRSRQRLLYRVRYLERIATRTPQ
jgi:hypothetical protein